MSNHSQLFREAWAESTGDPAVDALLNRSLRASARRIPELVAVARELELAGRSQLDLHLEGLEEAKHQTSASALGDFLKRVSSAVRESAKSIGGMRRLPGDISVLAPAMGSVRIVFIEQSDPKDLSTGGTRADFWAFGMERVASTFELAMDDRDELDASIRDLSLPARKAMRLLAQTIEAHSWSVEGSMTSRDGSRRDVVLSQGAAKRLIDAIQLQPTRSYEISASGFVDGWRWTSSTMRLAGSNAPAIEAFVPRDLQSEVSDFHSTPGDLVAAKFEVTESVAPRSKVGAIKKSYRLKSIGALPSLFDDDSE